MSNVWRNGFDPQKTDRGLRGIGLFVILIAFLVTANKFVGADKGKTTPTTPAKPPVVLADRALATLLPKIDATPRYTYADLTPSTTPDQTTPATSTSPAAIAASDVVITADSTLLTNLVVEHRCATPVAIADDTASKRGYMACAVFHGANVSPAAQAFITKLTGVEARVAILDAGLDLPPRDG